jgi:hypothetical protein
VLSAATTAQVDGVPVPMIDDGGASGGTCDLPIFALGHDAFPAPQPESLLVISDASKTVRARFAGMFAARTVALVSPGAALHPGDTAVLAVSPATDRPDPGVEFRRGSTVEECMQEGNSAGPVLNGTVEGNRVTFTVPDVALANGCVCLDFTHAANLACEGAGECDVSYYNFMHADALCVPVSVGT